MNHLLPQHMSFEILKILGLLSLIMANCTTTKKKKTRIFDPLHLHQHQVDKHPTKFQSSSWKTVSGDSQTNHVPIITSMKYWNFWIQLNVAQIFMWHFMSNLAVVSSKAENVYSTGAPGPWSQFLVESRLLIYLCFFVHVILVISCSLFSLSSSLEYIPLIITWIWVPLIILQQYFEKSRSFNSFCDEGPIYTYRSVPEGWFSADVLIAMLPTMSTIENCVVELPILKSALVTSNFHQFYIKWNLKKNIK